MITTVVTSSNLYDLVNPSLTATNSFTVIVQEVNQAPVLTAITNRIAREGRLLTFTNVASDPDLPTNRLTFSLGPNAPSGATVNPISGVFTWTPSPIQGGVTNQLSVIVTDNGVPPLSATQQFSVVVLDTLGDFDLGLGTTTVLAGNTNSVSVILRSGLELAHLNFIVEAPETRLSLRSLRPVSSATGTNRPLNRPNHRPVSMASDAQAATSGGE